MIQMVSPYHQNHQAALLERASNIVYRCGKTRV